MAKVAVICPTPTDPVSQYTTACVIRALDGDEAPDDAEAEAMWRDAQMAASEASLPSPTTGGKDAD